jgi:hypothetical protein
VGGGRGRVLPLPDDSFRAAAAAAAAVALVVSGDGSAETRLRREEGDDLGRRGAREADVDGGRGEDGVSVSWEVLEDGEDE